jgi:hypothetical protein
MTLPIEALETRRLLSFAPIQLGTKGLDAGFQTAIDAQGNTIVSGIFQHTMTLGTDTSGTAVKVTAVGETDIFIAKYDTSGHVLWAGHIGGEQSSLDKKPNFPIDPSRLGSFVTGIGPYSQTLGENLGAMAVDASGDVFLGGSFLRTADFDPGPGVFTLTATSGFGQSYTDAFLIKIDPSGKLLWADAFGGSFDDMVNAVAVDPQGDPVVTGYFTRSADFDPTSKGVFTVNAEGRDDIFVAKYTGAGGKLVWVDNFGSDTTKISWRDSGNGISIDSVGNILVTGTYTGKTDFDPGPSVVISEAVKATDVFVLKLSPRGKRVWVDTFGGKGFDGGEKVIAQGDSVYAVAYFTGEVDVNPGPATIDFVSVADDEHTDLVISKYDASNGKLEWAKQLGGDGFETVGGFAVAPDGSVYTSGGFYDPVDFDPGSGRDIITSVEGDDNFDDPNDNGRDFSYDIFVQHLSTNGKFLGATSLGSSGDDFGGGLALSSDGTYFALTGQFRNTVPFDPTDGTNKLKSKGSTDGFLIEMSDKLKLLT